MILLPIIYCRKRQILRDLIFPYLNVLIINIFRPKKSAPLNFTTRMTHRGSQFPPHGGLDGHKLDRKLVYSKFRPMKVFRNTAEEDMPENPFHSCAFTPTDQVTKLKASSMFLFKILNKF